MEGRNWSMYGLAIDVTELWPASKDLWGSIYDVRDV